MPDNDVTYNVDWEEEYKFLRPGPSVYRARCEDCKSVFSIKNGGCSDIKQHCRTKKHQKLSQKAIVDISMVIEDNDSSVNSISIDENNNGLELSPQEKVMKAETLQALKVVSSNYSFASACDDGDRFREMFPDSVIAKNYHQSKTKVNYTIKHGISPYVKDLYLNDFKGSPFVFKFDETTTVQVKKQYDGYVQYWSNEQNLISTVYCGSLFVGHCFSKDLIDHFSKFGEDMEWEPDLLLQVGMDGPNVNLKFEKDLSSKIMDEYGVSFLNIGTCTLHQTHNAFRKGILDFGFDIETFVNDANFFLSYLQQEGKTTS